MKMLFTLLLTVLCYCAPAQHGTGVLNFEDGIYLNLAEFRANSPSLTFAPEAIDEIEERTNNIIIKEVSYLEHGEIETIHVDSIWGFCINGTPFVKHERIRRKFGGFETFCKLHSFGELAIYFIESASPGLAIGGGPVVIGLGKQSGSMEIVINLATGQKYNLENDRKELIEWLEQDRLFAGSNLKRKAIRSYIGQYNRAHPFYFDK